MEALFLKHARGPDLTGKGRSIARAIRDTVLSTVVSVQDASGVREAPISEALVEMPASRSLLDVVREVIESGIVDLRS